MTKGSLVIKALAKTDLSPEQIGELINRLSDVLDFVATDPTISFWNKIKLLCRVCHTPDERDAAVFLMGYICREEDMNEEILSYDHLNVN